MDVLPPGVFAGVATRPVLRAALSEIIGRHSWAELDDFGMRRLLAAPQPLVELSSLVAPMLVLVGDGDLPAHHACARLIVRAAPTAELRVIRDAGHLAPLEEPEAAAAVITAHLQTS